MTQDVELANTVDVDDDDRYGYTYPWIKNRTFLKQLVKDNIDISIFEKELSRSAQQRGSKSWREFLLGCLRSNLLQIILSLLVLLDAGIVISEIVLEIQSLQSYKQNFHVQLAEVRRILCRLIYSSSPRKYHHPQCPNTVPGYEYNASEVRGPANLGPTQTVSFRTAYSYSHTTHRTNIWHDDMEKDNELLESMYNLVRHWVTHYANNLECVLITQPKISTRSALTFHRLYRSARHVVQPSLNRIAKAIPPNFDTPMTTPLSWLNNSSVSPQQTEASSMNEIHSNFTRVLMSDGAKPGLSGAYDEVVIAHRPIGAQTMHEASEILHYLSISITSLFLFCVILKICCLGKRFFRDTNEYLDAGIIVASFASDILYVRYVSETAAAMVVLLLWRIIRIINALMMHKQQQYELRISMQKRARRLMGRKLEIIRTEKEMQDKHILALEELLRELGSTNEAIRKCKPRYKKCTKEQTSNALKSIAALTTGVMGGLVGAPQTMQGVISRFSGTTGMNTPTASQKSLHGLNATGSTANLLTKGSSRVKSGPMELDSLSDEANSMGHWRKSMSGTLDRLDRRAHVYSPPAHSSTHRKRLFNSSQRSLFQDMIGGVSASHLARGYLTRGASMDSEYPPITSTSNFPTPPINELYSHEAFSSTEPEQAVSTVVSVHALHTESATPPNLRPSPNNVDDVKQSANHGSVTIQDLCYPRRLWYLQRFRLANSRSSLAKYKLWRGLKRNSFEESRRSDRSPIHLTHELKKVHPTVHSSQQQNVPNSSVPGYCDPQSPNFHRSNRVSSGTMLVFGEDYSGKTPELPLESSKSDSTRSMPNASHETNGNVSDSYAHCVRAGATENLSQFYSISTLMGDADSPSGNGLARTDTKMAYGNPTSIFSCTTTIGDEMPVVRTPSDESAELSPIQINDDKQSTRINSTVLGLTISAASECTDFVCQCPNDKTLKN